jgi:hypothetical protein
MIKTLLITALTMATTEVMKNTSKVIKNIVYLGTGEYPTPKRDTVAIDDRDDELRDSEGGQDVEEYLKEDETYLLIGKQQEYEPLEQIVYEINTFDDYLASLPTRVVTSIKQLDDIKTGWNTLLYEREIEAFRREEEQKESIIKTRRRGPLLAYHLYNILKCKYGMLENTKVNRMILHDHLISWFDRRTTNEKDIRRQDMIRHMPEAIELFFIPNEYEISANRIGCSEQAIYRYFEMSNPSFKHKLVYYLDPNLWKRWYHDREDRVVQ